MSTEKSQHPECPFVVGERYKDHGGEVYRFAVFAEDAREDCRAVFVHVDNGYLTSRRANGRRNANVYTNDDILPEPLPRVMYANKYTIGESGNEVWYLYKDKAHADVVSGNYPPGKLYAIAEPVEVPRD